MRKILYSTVLAVLCFSILGSLGIIPARAQQNTSHTITYFQGNKPGAVSFTFDDGYVTQVTNILPEMNSRGIKGTFFLITSAQWIGWEVPWATWATVAAQGHEIGSHTVNHDDLTTLTQADLITELAQSQATIRQNIPDPLAAITLAYPYTNINSSIEAATANYYIAARGGYTDQGGFINYYSSGQDQFGSWSAVDFYNTGSMNGADILSTGGAYFNSRLNLTAQRHGWLDIHFHQSDDTHAPNPTLFGSILDYIQGKNLYWIDTYSTIVRYMKERMNSTVQVVTDTLTEIRLQIAMDSSLPTSIYNVPLTIRSTVPSSWTQVYVRQGNSTQVFTPVIEGADSVIYYNALPNGGDIILTPPNPVPSLTSLSPSSAFAGGGAFTLTVNGTNFVSDSVVRWNNSDRFTTYVDGTQLTASISALDIAAIGSANVTVYNPAPGGGVSNSLSFAINQAPPGVFGKSTPNDGDINQTVDLNLSWNASSDAASYEYCYDTTNDNACSNWMDNGISASAPLTGLARATTYYWQARAINQSGTTYADGSSSAYWSFTTIPNPPTLTSIIRSDASPTNAASVHFTVTFSQAVNGVTAANFGLNSSGISGASIMNVTGSGDSRIVTVGTGSGDGTLSLSMISGNGITDDFGSGFDANGLPFEGQAYSIKKSAPSVSISAPSTTLTNVGPVDFAIIVNGATTINLQNSDVTLNKTGTADATIVQVTDGNTDHPMVTLGAITGAGTLGISLPSGFAFDAVSNSNSAAGPSDTVTVDNLAPQVEVDGVVSNAGVVGFDFQVFTGDVTNFTIKFNKDVYDPAGDSDPKDVTNLANYLLVRDLGTIPEFQTTSCASGVASPDDTQITIDSPVEYENSAFTATFTVNNGEPLSNGKYRLFICGTTSIRDLAGNHLNGQGTAGTDFIRSFIVNIPNGGGGNSGNNNSDVGNNLLRNLPGGQLPVTGFAPGRITKLPEQPAALNYTSVGKMTLEIPDLGINLPIVGVPLTDTGWNLTWLGNNVGYLDGTAYPTWAGNTILTAHVMDAANAPGPFANLKDLKIGERIYIHANGFKYVYQIEINKLALSSDASSAFEHEEYDWLTLMTCEDYINSLQQYTSRRIIKAVLVSLVSEK